MNATLKTQLDTIEAAFARQTSLSADHAERLLNLLDVACDDALQMIVDRRVKFAWIPAQRRLNERKVKAMAGRIVKIKIAKIGGQMTVAGRLTRIMDDGQWEIKTQGHGYHVVSASEVIS